MKIYTKTGDSGQTGLFGGGRVPKSAPRIEVFGTLDELNSVVGLVLCHLETESLRSDLIRVQHDLFCLGSELALNPDKESKVPFRLLEEASVHFLEQRIDLWEKELQPLRNFILPGGSKAAAYLHQARAVGRRAERHLVRLSEQDTLRPLVLIYLNRLSDWFFVLARLVNQRADVEDQLWQPQSK